VTICIVDTSILDELLNIPGWASHHDGVLTAYARRQQGREAFLLPIAVLIEAGNHIAQVPDGARRRKAAELFQQFARSALDGQTPFTPTPLPLMPDLAIWLDDFPERAMQGIGLADRSLIALWDHHREVYPSRRVYIWSLDRHLAGFDTGSGG
jgi:hypothetical protein